MGTASPHCTPFPPQNHLFLRYFSPHTSHPCRGAAPEPHAVLGAALPGLAPGALPNPALLGEAAKTDFAGRAGRRKGGSACLGEGTSREWGAQTPPGTAARSGGTTGELGAAGREPAAAEAAARKGPQEEGSEQKKQKRHAGSPQEMTGKDGHGDFGGREKDTAQHKAPVLGEQGTGFWDG